MLAVALGAWLWGSEIEEEALQEGEPAPETQEAPASRETPAALEEPETIAPSGDEELRERLQEALKAAVAHWENEE